MPLERSFKRVVEILETLEYLAMPLEMHRLEEKRPKYSNEIRLPDDLTIREINYNNIHV